MDPESGKPLVGKGEEFPKRAGESEGELKQNLWDPCLHEAWFVFRCSFFKIPGGKSKFTRNL